MPRSHKTPRQESRHACEWIVCIRNSRVIREAVRWATSGSRNQWVMSHRYESRHTCKWIVSHTWNSRVIREAVRSATSESRNHLVVESDVQNCDMTRRREWRDSLHVYHDSFICVPWRIHIVWQDGSESHEHCIVESNVDNCDMACRRAWFDSFVSGWMRETERDGVKGCVCAHAVICGNKTQRKTIVWCLVMRAFHRLVQNYWVCLHKRSARHLYKKKMYVHSYTHAHTHTNVCIYAYLQISTQLCGLFAEYPERHLYKDIHICIAIIIHTHALIYSCVCVS